MHHSEHHRGMEPTVIIGRHPNGDPIHVSLQTAQAHLRHVLGGQAIMAGSDLTHCNILGAAFLADYDAKR